MVAGTLVGEIDDAARDFAEELITYFAAKEKFVGVAIEQESKTCIEPRPAEQLEIGEGRCKVEGGKHGQGFVEFFYSSAVVEKEKTIDKGSLAPSDENVFCAKFGLEETMRRRECAGRSNAMVGHAVEDDILARARGEIVDGLEHLIGDTVEFEG